MAAPFDPDPDDDPLDPDPDEDPRCWASAGDETTAKKAARRTIVNDRPHTAFLRICIAALLGFMIAHLRSNPRASWRYNTVIVI